MPIYLLDAPAATNNNMSSYLTLGMIAVFAVLFWLLIMRPQKKQEKEAAQMRDSIKAGDEVITIGGIIGRVVIVRDDKIMIETGNDKTKLTILKSSVKSVEPEVTEEQK